MLRRLFPYFIQGISVGLIAGVVFVFLQSSGPAGSGRVVEIRQAPPVEAGDRSGITSFAPAVKAAAPAVVNIFTTKTIRRRHPSLGDPMLRRFFGDRPPPASQQTSLGSGVIVSEQGYVLTNNHVIDGSDEILVALNDDQTFPATIVGNDPESDLAVLKIAVEGLRPIVFGHADTLAVGDIVLAIGNPFGVGQTVTQGIVSARNRGKLGISTFEDFIQTDAAINPGNSGGALIDTLGRLVGINTAIFSRSGGSQGIGFAIPVELARQVMQQIIESGHAIRGWLGIEIQTLTPPLAETFGTDQAEGALIAGTLEDGPASRAGLQAGDIIVAIDGEPVKDAREALNLIAGRPPGSRVEIEIVRNGQTEKREVVIGQRPLPEGSRQ